MAFVLPIVRGVGDLVGAGWVLDVVGVVVPLVVVGGSGGERVLTQQNMTHLGSLVGAVVAATVTFGGGVTMLFGNRSRFGGKSN